MQQDYADQGLVVVGVNTGGLRGGDDEDQVRRFVDQTGVDFNVGLDQGQSHTQFRSGRRISPFPIDVIIDEEGRIQLIRYEFDEGQLRGELDQLFGLAPNPPDADAGQPAPPTDGGPSLDAGG